MIGEIGAESANIGAVDHLIRILEAFGRLPFLVEWDQTVPTEDGRIGRRDCYEAISNVAFEAFALVQTSGLSGDHQVPLYWCDIPFTWHEGINTAQLLMHLRTLTDAVLARDGWLPEDRERKWAAVADGAASLAVHAGRMTLAATTPEELAAGDAG